MFTMTPTKLSASVLFASLFLLAAPVAQGQWTEWLDDVSGNPYDIDELNGFMYRSSINEDIDRSSDNGATWEPVGPWNFGVRSMQVIGSSIFVGTLDGLFRSDDEGETWTDITGEMSVSFNGSRYVKRVRNLNGILYAMIGPWAATSVYRSTDNGATWTRQFLSDYVADVVELNGAFYLATNQSIFRSVDLGLTWTPVHPNGYSITGIWTHENTVYVVRAPGIIRSTDEGATWIQSSYPYPLSFGNFAIDGIFWNGYQYTNAGERLARSANGVDWEPYSDGELTMLPILALRKINNTVYFKAGNSIYTLNNTTGVEDQEREVMEAWPNPSAGEITVALPGSWAGAARYQLHNGLGVLIGEGAASGQLLQVPHPGSAGLYVLTVQQGDQVKRTSVVFE
jgi:photosystem II stability/assembly factor-like uncharacterized protein